MERLFPDVPDIASIIEEMKDKARVDTKESIGSFSEDDYHILEDGTKLRLTVDILNEELVALVNHLNRLKYKARIRPGKFWHLTIAHVDKSVPSDNEADFWMKAFFTEEPTFVLKFQPDDPTGRHIFWMIIDLEE